MDRQQRAYLIFLVDQRLTLDRLVHGAREDVGLGAVVIDWANRHEGHAPLWWDRLSRWAPTDHYTTRFLIRVEGYFAVHSPWERP